MFEKLKWADKESHEMSDRSGQIKSDNMLVSFIYLLGRDLLSLGQIEGIMRKLGHPGDTTEFSNGWLAEWSKDIARRLGCEEKQNG